MIRRILLSLTKKIKVEGCVIGAYQDVEKGKYKFSICLAKNENNVLTGEYDHSLRHKKVNKSDLYLKIEFPNKEVVDVMINQLKLLKEQINSLNPPVPLSGNARIYEIRKNA